MTSTAITMTHVFRQIRRPLALAALMAAIHGGAPAWAQPAGADSSEAMKRRFQIKVMEGVLVSAVRHGADLFGSELRPHNPNLMLLTGMARARGFVLDGYGVFFDVEIPGLRPSVAWTISTMALEPNPRVLGLVAQLRQQLAAVQDAGARTALERSVSQLERQLQSGSPVPPPQQSEPGAARRVSSATADDAPGAGAAPPDVPEVVKDPNALYTDAVKNALIDAMLDHSGPMGIGPDEWLTIAAKDAEGPLVPGEPYDAITMVLRIKGTDLAAFRADRLTREEARKRVEVREF